MIVDIARGPGTNGGWGMGSFGRGRSDKGGAIIQGNRRYAITLDISKVSIGHNASENSKHVRQTAAPGSHPIAATCRIGEAIPR